LFIGESGTGPAVVLLHGAPSSVAYFEPLVAALKSKWRVLVPEFPGYGPTPARPARSHSVIEELSAELAELGVAEAAVVGFSLGAYRALQLALHGKPKVSALFLMGGFAALAQAHRDGMRATAQGLAALPDFQLPSLRRQVASMMLAPDYAARHPESLDAVESWLDATTPAALAAELTAATQGEDLLPKLHALQIPVVARVGELDQAAPPAYSEQIVAAVKNGQLQRAAGCGHALLIEDREATIAAILEILTMKIDQASAR
jgi:pimeloyl-ACP methyl ester carboxylesterase